MNYRETEKIVKQASMFFAQKAIQQLKTTRKKLSIRASWKKVGDDWQPVDVKKKRINGVITSSGNLAKSIKPFSKGLEFGIEMDWYGQMVVNGRQPAGKNRGGKGIPISAMNTWLQMKRIKARDFKTGQYTKDNKAMGFLMNRKIKHFGIEGIDFVKDARQRTQQEYNNKFKEAVKQDLINNTKQ